MGRLAKKGLNYFPMDTNFLCQRGVRRLMKTRGDRVLCVLLTLYLAIYADEGYYIRTDKVRMEDIAANLFDFSVDEVREIIEAAVDCGIFDEELYHTQGVLTSKDIQQRYVFIKRQRKSRLIRPELSLLASDEEAADEAESGSCTRPTMREKDISAAVLPDLCTQNKEKKKNENKANSKTNSKANISLILPSPRMDEERRTGQEEDVLPAGSCDEAVYADACGTFVPAADEDAALSAGHSAASVAGHGDEDTALAAGHSAASVAAATRRRLVPDAGEHTASADERDGAASADGRSAASGTRRKTLAAGGLPPVPQRGAILTQEDVDALVPPADGLKRNYSGLLENLRLFGIPPEEQYALIRKSNFGLIGHSVWKGFSTLRSAGGKIKCPGRYLLSLR